MDVDGLVGEIGQAIQSLLPSFAPAPKPAPAPSAAVEQATSAAVEQAPSPAPAPTTTPSPGPGPGPTPQPQAQPASTSPSPSPAPVAQPESQFESSSAPPQQTHPSPAGTTHAQAAEEVTKTEFRSLSSDLTTTQSSTSTTTTITTTTSTTREPYGYLSTTPTQDPTLPPTSNGLTHDAAVGLGVGIGAFMLILLSALAVKFFCFDRRKDLRSSESNWSPAVFRKEQPVRDIKRWPKRGEYTNQESLESISSPIQPADVTQLSALTTAVPSTAGTTEHKMPVVSKRVHIVDYYKPGK